MLNEYNEFLLKYFNFRINRLWWEQPGDICSVSKDITQKTNPHRLHSAPQIQIESSYFYKRVWDGVSLALEVFGVDTSAGRVGHTWWSFPVLWGWREWFFWQREETLKRNATISISLCVTVLMIWVMEIDRKYLFPTYMERWGGEDKDEDWGDGDAETVWSRSSDLRI